MNTDGQSLRVISCASFIVLGLSLQAATAQESGEDETTRLETVEVTAQRLTQNAQDVPISITTLSDEKLANLSGGAADIRFLSARVPSVVAESSFGRTFPRFYIRGIGNTCLLYTSPSPRDRG